MKRAEWIELCLVAIIATASWFVRTMLPTILPVWEIVLGLSALSLAQSLVRDVTILIRIRKSPSTAPHKEMQCFCLESTVGASGILAGVILVGIGSAHQIAVNRWIFFLAVTATLAIGFLIKDLVISWNPIGLRREKDHMNVFVRWKNKTP